MKCSDLRQGRTGMSQILLNTKEVVLSYLARKKCQHIQNSSIAENISGSLAVESSISMPADVEKSLFFVCVRL